MVNGIELTEPPGASTHILRDLSEHATLAFIASIDFLQAHGQSAKRFTAVQAPALMTPPHKRITYIALAEMCMPKLGEIFLQFIKEMDEVFVDGTVGAVLSAYTVPIKPKYECLPSSKFVKDLPLWKTATSCFLNIVKENRPQINVLGSSMIYFDIYGC
jgi:hypothetical protein